MRSILAQGGVLRDVVIIVACLVAVWVGLQAYFGTQNPFYVVSSGSMVPELVMYDILVVSGNSPFGEVDIGDIIVFNRPSDHDRVIVHRVVSVSDEDPRTLRTKGDANPSSIPGTDFPITAEEYIGSVVYVIPQAGYITRVLSPPVNYIIIAVIVGIMVTKHLYGRKGGGEEEEEEEEAGGGEEAGGPEAEEEAGLERDGGGRAGPEAEEEAGLERDGGGRAGPEAEEEARAERDDGGRAGPEAEEEARAERDGGGRAGPEAEEEARAERDERSAGGGPDGAKEDRGGGGAGPAGAERGRGGGD